VRAADGGGEQGELVYAPYGQLLDAQPAGTDVTQSRWAGMEPDRADLYYARYRYYHPHIGRFISEDPIGLAGGMNLFAYVGGDPVNFTDPLGLSPYLEFGGDVWSQGLATGWAGFSTAVWSFPGLSHLNQAFSLYDAGTYKCQPGFKTSVAFGTIGVDALAWAGGLKLGGMATGRIPFPGAEKPLSLLQWWNSGIDTKVPWGFRLLYEIGQKTLSPDEFAKYGSYTFAIDRGRALVNDKGWLRALWPSSTGFMKSGDLTKGNTLSTGPTPLGRTGVRTLGFAAMAAFEYAARGQVLEDGWNDAVSSLR